MFVEVGGHGQGRLHGLNSAFSENVVCITELLGLAVLHSFFSAFLKRFCSESFLTWQVSFLVFGKLSVC